MLRLTFYLFLLFSTVSFGQDKVLDSLNNLLKSSKNNIEKVEKLNDLAYYYSNFDSKIALNFANKALLLAKKGKDNWGIADSYKMLGNIETTFGNYDKSLEYLFKAKKILEELSLHKQTNRIDCNNKLGTCLCIIGNIYNINENNTLSADYYLKAIAKYKESNNIEKCIPVFNNLGLLYQNSKNYNQSIHYYLECLKYKELNKDKQTGMIYSNLAGIYLENKNFELAQKYIEKAKLSFKKIPNPRAQIGLFYIIANYYSIAKDFENALLYYNKAANLCYKCNFQSFLSSTYYSRLSNVYIALKQYDKALICNKKSISLLSKESNAMNESYLLQHQSSVIYEHQKQYKPALKNLQDYLKIHNSIVIDSVNNVVKSIETKKDKIIESIRNKYLDEKRKVLHLKAINNDQKSKLDNNEIIIYALLIALAGLFCYMIFRKNSSTN